MILFTDYKEVQKRVSEVLWLYTCSDNLDATHKAEVALYEDFASYVANGGCVLLRLKAKEILKVQSLKETNH